MGRGYRIVSQNRQCVRTPLSASINRHLDFRIFICRKEEASQLLTGFIDLLNTIRQKLDVFSVLLKDTDIHPTRKDFQTIACIIRRILDIPELTPGLLTLPLLNETLNEYREVVVHGQKT